MWFFDFFRRRKKNAGQPVEIQALPDHSNEREVAENADIIDSDAVIIEEVREIVKPEAEEKKDADPAVEKSDVSLTEQKSNTDPGIDETDGEVTAVPESKGSPDIEIPANMNEAAKNEEAAIEGTDVTEDMDTSKDEPDLQENEYITRLRELVIDTERKIHAAEGIKDAETDTQISQADENSNAESDDSSDKDTDKEVKEGTTRTMEKEKKNKKAKDKEKIKEKKNKDLVKAEEKESKKEKKTAQKSLYEWNRSKKNSVKKSVVEKKPVQVGPIVLGEGLPKICIPVVGRNSEEIEAEAVQAVKARPDIVEWRVDFYEDILDEDKAGEMAVRLKEILGDLPVLFTFRTANEGGNKAISGSDYEKLLVWAAHRKEFAVLDIEGQFADADIELVIEKVHAAGTPVIASSHYFDRTPKKAELEHIFDLLERTGADVLKLAVMPEKPKDVIRLMNATVERNEQTSCPLITMSMGDLGKISRVSGGLTGSALTFGTASQASAPGQLPANALRAIVEVV